MSCAASATRLSIYTKQLQASRLDELIKIAPKAQNFFKMINQNSISKRLFAPISVCQTVTKSRRRTVAQRGVKAAKNPFKFFFRILMNQLFLFHHYELKKLKIIDSLLIFHQYTNILCLFPHIPKFVKIFISRKNTKNRLNFETID